MAYEVILKHLEVDKITWGVIFFKKKISKRGGPLFKEERRWPFRRERGAGHPFFFC
jgi:hypothetical protein